MEASQSGEDQTQEQEGSATDQSSTASEQEERIEGDPGFGEQQPVPSEGTPSSQDRPHTTSGPPPSSQSGVPLEEDRAAGVEPGPDASSAVRDPSGATLGAPGAGVDEASEKEADEGEDGEDA